jgi:malate dehydrogenase (oxaloacetate-decarboxylating)(NADP+)
MAAPALRRRSQTLEGLNLKERNLSWPKQVALAGGADAWNNKTQEQKALIDMIDGMVSVTTWQDALQQVKSMIELGHFLWANMFLRMLQVKSTDVYFALMMREPSLLLPVMYTPTVGEVCQKYGKLPFYRRGCYLSIDDRGKFKQALQEYADSELPKDKDGKPMCDCIVFSDGGRILGLGDLGAWGMGIPIGKLDLYTVCGGVNPHRVIPLIIDAGCGDETKNTDKLTIRDHPLYTGVKKDRVMQKSAAGTMVNSAYYGEGNMIEEFMKASTELFGENILMQFEDFNSNDAFPLLAEYREKYLTYNDDIQGTAAVTVAAVLGAIKLKDPKCTNLVEAMRKETILFHGAGSANLGGASLLVNEGKVPSKQVLITNSRGLVWFDGKEGTHRNEEQKAFAYQGKPGFDSSDLVTIIKNVKPTILCGAVGVAPNCFTKEVVEAMMESCGAQRPIIFALSNPKTQAEITAQSCYTWSNGTAIFGSGTFFDPVKIGDKTHSPGQVNNVYIFPGMSFGAICCQAKTIPDALFLSAAEAVANSLNDDDFAVSRVIPHRDRVQMVNFNVATAVCEQAQKLGIAKKNLGSNTDEVKAALKELMWVPGVSKDPEAPVCQRVVSYQA